MTEEKIQAVLNEAEDDIASARALLIDARIKPSSPKETRNRNAYLRSSATLLEMVVLSMRRLSEGE